jgi:GNAT superfamily N-acetyltransferase
MPHTFTSVDTIAYRRADPVRDFAFARRVHHSSYRDVIERQFGVWDEQLQNTFFKESWVRSPHYIVSKGEMPVGVVSYGDVPEGLYIYEVQILPEYQGQGTGTRFLAERIEEALHRGVSLRLKVLRENRARELYARMGFVSYEENDVDVKMEWRGSRD